MRKASASISLSHPPRASGGQEGHAGVSTEHQPPLVSCVFLRRKAKSRPITVPPPSPWGNFIDSSLAWDNCLPTC